MVNIATKNLLHDRLRLVITVSGIAFAVLLVFVQVGLFMGLMHNATVAIERADADLWIAARNTPNFDFGQGFPENYWQRVQSVPGVDRAANLIVYYSPMALPNGAQETVELYAMEDFERWNLPWRVREGRLEDLRRGAFLFVDDAAARRLGPFRVGEYREIAGRRLRIIGRTAEVESFATTPVVLMDFRRAQALLGAQFQGLTTFVLVKLRPGADPVAVRDEIRRRLPYNDVWTRGEWASRSRRYWVVNTGLGFNMYVTVFLGCLVGVVVVTLTLYTSTLEHLREFATVKAIGGSDWDIYQVLGQQATIAAAAGFALGALPTLGIPPLFAAAGLRFLLPGGFPTIVFAATVVLCNVAAVVSFRRVASIDPVTVLRA